MAKITFTRIEDSKNINNVDIIDGQITACGDGKIFIDYDSKRVNAGGLNNQDVIDITGNKEELDTENKTDLVSAINEIFDGVFYKDGETFELPLGNEYMTSGLITSASKDIAFNIYLPKSLKNINEISLDEIQAYYRHVGGGYIAHTLTGTNTFDLGDSDISWRIAKYSDNCINIRMTSTTTLNATNNTPIAVAMNFLKLSFKEVKSEQ